MTTSTPSCAAAPAGRRAPARVANTEVETIKVVGLRRRIAQKMAESKRRVAHFSYVEEIDVTALEELRATLNAEKRPDRPRLTLMPFLMQALVKAVADFPEMNALYDDEAETIERHGGVHIGIATQTPAGLMVPVVRHCEARGLWELRRRGPAPGRGRARGPGDPRRALGLDHHHHQPGRAGRHRDHAGDQPAGSRDHRRQQAGRAAGLAGRRSSCRAP